MTVVSLCCAAQFAQALSELEREVFFPLFLLEEKKKEGFWIIIFEKMMRSVTRLITALSVAKTSSYVRPLQHIQLRFHTTAGGEGCGCGCNNDHQHHQPVVSLFLREADIAKASVAETSKWCAKFVRAFHDAEDQNDEIMLKNLADSDLRNSFLALAATAKEDCATTVLWCHAVKLLAPTITVNLAIVEGLVDVATAARESCASVFHWCEAVAALCQQGEANIGALGQSRELCDAVVSMMAASPWRGVLMQKKANAGSDGKDAQDELNEWCADATECITQWLGAAVLLNSAPQFTRCGEFASTLVSMAPAIEAVGEASLVEKWCIGLDILSMSAEQRSEKLTFATSSFLSEMAKLAPIVAGHEKPTQMWLRLFCTTYKQHQDSQLEIPEEFLDSLITVGQSVCGNPSLSGLWFLSLHLLGSSSTIGKYTKPNILPLVTSLLEPVKNDSTIVQMWCDTLHTCVVISGCEVSKEVVAAMGSIALRPTLGDECMIWCEAFARLASIPAYQEILEEELLPAALAAGRQCLAHKSFESLENFCLAIQVLAKREGGKKWDIATDLIEFLLELGPQMFEGACVTWAAALSQLTVKIEEMTPAMENCIFSLMTDLVPLAEKDSANAATWFKLFTVLIPEESAKEGSIFQTSRPFELLKKVRPLAAKSAECATGWCLAMTFSIGANSERPELFSQYISTDDLLAIYPLTLKEASAAASWAALVGNIVKLGTGELKEKCSTDDLIKLLLAMVSVVKDDGFSTARFLDALCELIVVRRGKVPDAAMHVTSALVELGPAATKSEEGIRYWGRACYFIAKLPEHEAAMQLITQDKTASELFECMMQQITGQAQPPQAVMEQQRKRNVVESERPADPAPEQ